MKCFVIIFFLYLNSISSLAQISRVDSSNYLTGFREVKWGSSIDDVKHIETSLYLQQFSGFGIEAISFSSEVAGRDVRIDYTFRRNQLIEGSYNIKSAENYRDDFISFFNFIKNQYGDPVYRAGPLYNSSEFWVKENNYGMFKGPSLYWEFSNGFIALLSEKLNDNITISIIFVSGKTIKEYAAGNTVEINGN